MSSDENRTPNVARPAYTPLSKTDQSIRLLHLLPSPHKSSPLRAQLTHVSLQSNPPAYDALSYVWGPPDFSETITVDGRDCGITTSLDSALRRLRDRFTTRVLWVDQICINQDDLVERSSQVLLMGKLYSTADNVVAWLGTWDFRDIDAEIDWLRHWLIGLRDNRSFEQLYLSTPSWTLRAITRKATYAVARVGPSKRLRFIMMAREFHVLDRLRNCLEAFDQTAYWSRMWILQEFILARKAPILLLGEKLELDEDFMQAAVWARGSEGLFHHMAEKMEKANQKRALGKLGKHDPGSVEDVRQEVRRDIQQAENAKMLMNEFGFIKHVAARETYKHRRDGWLLSSLLRDTYGIQAGNVRDKVYALYSIAPSNYDLPLPDYTAPADKVLRDIVARVIAVERDIGIYDWMSPSPPDSPYPSWTPNFSAEDCGTGHEEYNLMRRIIFAPHGAQASRGVESGRDPSVHDDNILLRLCGWQVEPIGDVCDLAESRGYGLKMRAKW